jgi:hypothetical protein
MKKVEPIGVDSNNNLLYEDGIEPIVIRTTERTNFKSCRRLWYYTSKLHRNLEPVRMNHNLAFGIAIHVGLQGFYDPETWHMDQETKLAKGITFFVNSNNEQKRQEGIATGGLSPERLEEYKRREQLGIDMLTGYAKWAYHRDNFTPVYVEQKFQVPIIMPGTNDPMVVMYNGKPTPVVYQVRIDLVLEENDTGDWWICDHKTAGNISGSTEFLELDTQMSSYAWAAQIYYKRPIAGIIYNELEKNAPKPPRVLKNGSLSKDKSQLTNYELYLQAISEKSLDPDQYADILEHLRDNPREYFRRTPLHRSSLELATQGKYVVQEVTDMLSSPALYPNPNKMKCNGCDFRHPCITQNEGRDVEFVLNDPMQYRQRVSEDIEHAESL